MVVYCLYEITTLKIRYIGITSKKLKTRLYQHFYHKGKNPYKDNWINKNNNKIGIRGIKKFNTPTQARKLELYLIRKYKNSHKLVNLQDRGFCGDKKKLSKSTCDKISKTLVKAHKENRLKKYGEKPVFVFNARGKFIARFNNAVICARELNIPYSKIAPICNNHKGCTHYADYTFTREGKVPFERYIKCYDSLTKEMFLSFKMSDIKVMVRNLKFNGGVKYINANTFYLNRYNIRKDNNFPPIITGNIICNGKKYKNLSTLMKENNISFINYPKIREHLNNNVNFVINNYTIKAENCAWYKFGELTGNSLESYTLSYGSDTHGGKQ